MIRTEYCLLASHPARKALNPVKKLWITTSVDFRISSFCWEDSCHDFFKIPFSGRPLMEKVMDDRWLMHPPHPLCHLLSLPLSLPNHCVVYEQWGRYHQKLLCRYPLSYGHLMPFPWQRKLHCLPDSGSPETPRTTLFVQGPEPMHVQGTLCDVGPLAERRSERGSMCP